jgi:hypothetical protein
MSDALTDDEILRLLMQRDYMRVEPAAAVTLLRMASHVDRAQHRLDRVRHSPGIEDDDCPEV